MHVGSAGNRGQLDLGLELLYESRAAHGKTLQCAGFFGKRGKPPNESKTSYKLRLARIMREAAFPDVWQFLTPEEAWRQLDEVEPLLGRRRAFWKYILNTLA